MKRAIILFLFCCLSVVSFSQKILLAENCKSLKNFKFCQGDAIILKIDGGSERIFDEILDMNDSSIVLINFGIVRLDEISGIYFENWLIQITRGLSLLGGAAYFGLDSFNRLINNDSPVILAETAIISGSLVALSFALTPLRYRKYDTHGKWKLRTIDLNDFQLGL